MKFTISFLISLNAFGNPINIFHEKNLNDAEMYRNIMLSDYFIPEELIRIREVTSCEESRVSGQLDLCLKNNGDLYLVSVDRDFINESLKVFQSP